MFNVAPHGMDIRLLIDPYAANVIFYMPMTDAISTSPYNGQAIPTGGNLNDYGVNSLGATWTGQDISQISSATASTTGGTLAANTYYIRVYAYNASNALLKTTQEVQVTTTGTTSSIALTWLAVSGASYYRAFIGTVTGVAGVTTNYVQTASTSLTMTTTATGSSAALPSSINTTLVPVTSNSGTRTQKWAKFAGTSGSTTAGQSAAVIFNHSSFNNITNGTGDFTIEFNVKVVGDGQGSGVNGQNLKVFPFSFVGTAVNAVNASVSSPLNPDPGEGQFNTQAPSTQSSGAAVVLAGEQMEMGMTLGSHTSPGGFGFGIGPADGSNRGYAAACTTNDANANGYVNRGFPAVPTGNTSATTWGPYHMAVCRQSGVISIFLNGKKINTQVGADEGGDGTHDASSTWNWNTFKLNTLTGASGTGGITTTGYSSGTGVYGNNTTEHGLFIGGSYTYSSYGADDDIYLQHFRITQGVARYSADFTPEAIYTVTP